MMRAYLSNYTDFTNLKPSADNRQNDTIVCCVKGLWYVLARVEEQKDVGNHLPEEVKKH